MPSVSIISYAPRLFASVRRTVTAATLSDTVLSAPVWTRKLHMGLEGTGIAVLLFPDGAEHAHAGDTEFIVDFGLEVTSPVPEDPILTGRVTPAGRAARAEFGGAYSDSAASVHQAIREWCAANGHALAGPVFELHEWHQDPVLQRTWVHYMLA